MLCCGILHQVPQMTQQVLLSTLSVWTAWAGTSILPTAGMRQSRVREVKEHAWVTEGLAGQVRGRWSGGTLCSATSRQGLPLLAHCPPLGW